MRALIVDDVEDAAFQRFYNSHRRSGVLMAIVLILRNFRVL